MEIKGITSTFLSDFDNIIANVLSKKFKERKIKEANVEKHIYLIFKKLRRGQLSYLLAS